MGRNSGGYTIIEVMIVLAVTGIIFTSAVLVFQGQQGRTGFSQAMQDLSSKIESYASSISAGNYDGSSSYYCYVSGGVPTMQKGSAPSATGQQCVFLGRALQVSSGSGTINSYTIVGTRDNFNGTSVDSGNIATTLDQAKPTLATVPGAGGPAPILTDNFTLGDGATVVSSKTVRPGAEYDLVGIYDNLQSTAGSTGSNTTNLLIKPYNCTDTGCGNPPLNCISSAPCNALGVTSQWFLCIEGSSNQYALMEVDDTASGVSTKLNFSTASCS